MIYRVLLICVFIGISIPAEAQSRKKSKKTSIAQGVLFGYWGYNRSYYTKSDLRLVGEGYDFTLRGSRAKDNPSPLSELKTYVDPTRITVPQFNARIGYYFKTKYAISFGYDHMKYIFRDKNEVLLDGTIDPGVDDLWSGTYTNEKVVTDRDHFHYENSNGLNYLRANITRSDLLFRTPKRKFAVTSNLSLGLGGILSYNDFTFGQRKDVVTISLSGFALSAHASLRFEFFNHFFLETEATGGFMNQSRVRTRPNDRFAYAKQRYGYSMFSSQIGFFLYLKSINNCDDCPVW
jgi:hypothetical protein